MFIAMILTVILGRISKAATVLSVLMKVYTIPCHDRGHINVMLVLQSCTDSVQVLPGSSSGTFPVSSDGTYDAGNIKFEEDLGIKLEEELNIKTENIIFSEEEECIDIKDEDCMYSEEEEETEDIDLKEEVSCEDIV
jgi:hypothetical protein